MRSRVSYCFNVWTGKNDAKTLRVDARKKNEKKSCVFKRIRIGVDRA